MNDKRNKKFDFWNDHSLEFLEMAMKRDYQETPVESDGYGRRERECGDTIEIFLSIENDILKFISYEIKGCLFSHACANTMIKLANNKSVREAETIDRHMIIDYLKTLPKQEEHCADHVLIAFKTALDDYKNKK